MKWPLVTRKKYEQELNRNYHSREQNNRTMLFKLSIPVLTIDGIAEVAIIGSNEDVEKIKKTLENNAK